MPDNNELIIVRESKSARAKCPVLFDSDLIGRLSVAMSEKLVLNFEHKTAASFDCI